LAAFVLMAILARVRGARLLALICTLLALFCVGALRARFPAPGPPPEIDAT